MITQQTEPTLLIYAILILLAAGTTLLAFGRKLSRNGDWLGWVSLVLLAAAAGWDANLFIDQPFHGRIWWVGWILPREETNAITIGVVQDMIGLVIVAATAVLSAVVLLNAKSLSTENRPSRIYAGLLFAAAGASLSWISYTPWFSFMGIALSLLGGFVATGSRWDSNPEAGLTSRLGWERSWGLLLSFAGACIFAVARGPLVWGSAEAMAALGNTAGAEPMAALVGVVLLVAGVLVQLHQFPLFGWILTDSEHPLPVRTILSQAFPALAAFAILVRAQPFLASVGILSWIGWYSLGSTALLIVSALFSQKWRIGLSAWLSAGFSLAVTLLCFAGPAAGMSLLLGAVLGGSTLAIVGDALDREATDNPSNRKRAGWLKAQAFLGAALGTGFIGFISCFGLFQWLVRSWDDTIAAAAAVLVIFLFVHQGWRAMWSVFRLKPATDVSWAVILSPVLLILLGLGTWWTGAVSGGVLPPGTDNVLPSLFKAVFNADGAVPEPLFAQVATLYWACWAIAALSAYWISGRAEDSWKKPAERLPGFAKFVTRGYGLDQVGGKCRLGVAWLGAHTQHLVDERVWETWVPIGMSRAIRKVAGLFARVDHKMTEGLAHGTGKGFDSTARILQMIQTGDVRWYLFFAVGAGLLMMLQFLRT